MDTDQLIATLTDNLAEDLHVVLDKYRNQVRRETLNEVVDLIEQRYPNSIKWNSSAFVRDGIVAELRRMSG